MLYNVCPLTWWIYLTLKEWAPTTEASEVLSVLFLHMHSETKFYFRNIPVCTLDTLGELIVLYFSFQQLSKIQIIFNVSSPLNVDI